jgi:hypothetical protein
MTKDQIEGTIRTVLAALAAYLAGKGYFPQISPELLTAITTVLVGAWSLWSNRPRSSSRSANKPPNPAPGGSGH